MKKNDPLSLAMDSWSLGLEAWAVIGMRMPRLMSGDVAAATEAQLMVSEKLEAAASLQWKLMTGGLGTTTEAVVGSSLAHYRKAVRKNHRRLSTPAKRK